MAKILITTLGSLGDLHPFLTVGAELCRRGHEVTLASCSEFKSRVERAGLRFAAIPPDAPKREELPGKMKRWLDSRYGAAILLQEWIWPKLKEMSAQLEPLVASADVVIVHPLTLPASFWARKKKIPWIAAVYAPLFFASCHEPPVWGEMRPMTGLARKAPWLVKAMLGWIKWRNGRIFAPLKKARADIGLGRAWGHPVLDTFTREADLVLALFSKSLGRPQPDWPKKVVQTGFMFFDGHDTEMKSAIPEDLNRFLAGGPPPLVFTLGSTGIFMAGDFYRQAIETTKRLGQRAVLLTGWDDGTPIPDGVFAAAYAPYVEVFPKASVIIHHGGLNTTAQALRSGRPQLVVPFAHDQFDNAHRTWRAGCGLVLWKSYFTAERATPILQKLMTEPGYAQGAAKAAEIVRGEGGVMAAADAVEKLLPHPL